jgi:hypothetical protein
MPPLIDMNGSEVRRYINNIHVNHDSILSGIGSDSSDSEQPTYKYTNVVKLKDLLNKIYQSSQDSLDDIKVENLTVECPFFSLSEKKDIGLEKTSFFLAQPTVEPTVDSTVEPTVQESLDVIVERLYTTVETTNETTNEPTVEPTFEPTVEPIVEPTVEPIVEPTVEDLPVIVEQQEKSASQENSSGVFSYLKSFVYRS